MIQESISSLEVAESSDWPTKNAMKTQGITGSLKHL